MKRLLGLGFISTLLALASCSASVNDTNQNQTVACYDTGNGMKCVPVAQLPANTTAVCLDKDGTKASESNDTADTPDGDDDDDLVGNGTPAGDADSDSDSTSRHCTTGAPAGTDTDSDGISDSKDCDCVAPDAPTSPTTTPPGGGPVII
jgi:hypothetical protein